LYLETIIELGHEPRLLERKFSSQISQIDKFELSKVLRLVQLLFNSLREFGSEPKPNLFVCFISSSKYAAIADFLVCKLAELFGIPIILYFHTIPERFARENGYFYHHLFQAVKSLKVIVLGSHMKEFFMQELQVENSVIIPNTITDYESRNSTLTLSNTLRTDLHKEIVFLSNLQPGKGLEHFLHFAERVVASNADVIFRVIGPIIDQKYILNVQGKINALGLERNFIFMGYVSGEEKFLLLRDADFLLFTSNLREGQPLSILESISMGTPVLTFSAGGATDMVVSGVTGLVSNDINILADFYLGMLNGPSEYAKLRRESLSKYEMEFSLKSYIESWKLTLKNLSI
jgi:glycosyltransferase involved in cell wall biosynthesis